MTVSKIEMKTLGTMRLCTGQRRQNSTEVQERTLSFGQTTNIAIAREKKKNIIHTHRENTENTNHIYYCHLK